MKRWLCAWLPDFPLQRVTRGSVPDNLPLVLYVASSRQGALVAACDRMAASSGVRPGMPLAEAQSLIQSGRFEQHQPEHDLVELRALAESCQQFSPQVGLELSCGTHCLILDLAGVTHLFGGTGGLARQLVVCLAERGYRSYIAIGDTIGAAWALARYGHQTRRPCDLQSLPVEALRLPSEIVLKLHAFDLRCMADVLKLPRQTLPSRFGRMLTDRLEQLLGERPEALAIERPSEPIVARWASDEPVQCREAVDIICRRLLAEITSGLQTRGLGALRLRLQLHGNAESPLCLPLELIQPSDAPAHLLSLLLLRLEREPLPEAIHSVDLEISLTAPLRITQQTLFRSRDTKERTVPQLVSRLSARLGNESVARPRRIPDAQPERAVSYEPAISAPVVHPQAVFAKNSPSDQENHPLCRTRGGSASCDDFWAATARPVLLLEPPSPIRVVSVVPDGPPLYVTWQNHTYRIAQASDIEWIAAGWWRADGGVNRAYVRAETISGHRFWLFRDASGDWFLHGLFD